MKSPHLIVLKVSFFARGFFPKGQKVFGKCTEVEENAGDLRRAQETNRSEESPRRTTEPRASPRLVSKTPIWTNGSRFWRVESFKGHVAANITHASRMRNPQLHIELRRHYARTGRDARTVKLRPLPSANVLQPWCYNEIQYNIMYYHIIVCHIILCYIVVLCEAPELRPAPSANVLQTAPMQPSDLYDVYIYIYIHTHTYIHSYLSLSLYIYIYTYVCIYVYNVYNDNDNANDNNDNNDNNNQ